MYIFICLFIMLLFSIFSFQVWAYGRITTGRPIHLNGSRIFLPRAFGSAYWRTEDKAPGGRHKYPTTISWLIR